MKEKEKKDSWAARMLAEPRLGLAMLVGALIGLPGASYLTALHHLITGKYATAIVEGEPRGGYTDLYEIICCYCDDHPYLDYREVSPQLQAIRGPYPIAAGVAAYERHVQLHPADRLFQPRCSDGDGHSSQDHR